MNSTALVRTFACMFRRSCGSKVIHSSYKDLFIYKDLFKLYNY
nr:hypothetical protein [Vibrio sp.]